MVELNLNTILEGVILSAIVGIFNMTFSIREHLAKLNGRVGKTELAIELKTKTDDERHVACLAANKELWEAVRK